MGIKRLPLQLKYSCKIKTMMYHINMSKQEKLIQKLLKAKTLKWSDMRTLLVMLGYIEVQGNSSRVKFDNGNPEDLINVHKPHPSDEMRAYMVKQVREKLQKGGLI